MYCITFNKSINNNTKLFLHNNPKSAYDRVSKYIGGLLRQFEHLLARSHQLQNYVCLCVQTPLVNNFAFCIFIHTKCILIQKTNMAVPVWLEVIKDIILVFLYKV